MLAYVLNFSPNHFGEVNVQFAEVSFRSGLLGNQHSPRDARGCREAILRRNRKMGTKTFKSGIPFTWIGCFVLIFSISTLAYAAPIAEPYFNKRPGPDPTPVNNENLCAIVCEPNKEIRLIFGNDPRPLIVVKNDTPFVIDDLHLEILLAGDPRLANPNFPGQPIPAGFVQPVITWEDTDDPGTEVGASDIFRKITVSGDKRTISFSEGKIPPGGFFTDEKRINPAGTQFVVVTRFTVPESPTLLLFGAGLAGMAGVAWRRYRRS
jgi:hypothetical protein